MDINSAPDELEEYFRGGGAPSEVARIFGRSDKETSKPIEDRCAGLHNNGTIDLLSTAEIDALLLLSGTEFFSTIRFYDRLLPELEATPSKIMAFVEAIVSHGGQDLAANRLNESLRRWCAAKPDRAKAIIKMAHEGDGLASRNLTFALEAINAIKEALDFASKYNDKRRLSGLTALSRIEDKDEQSRLNTLTVLDGLLDENADDSLRANFLHTVASVLSQGSEEPPPIAVGLIKKIVKYAGEQTIHQAAYLLGSLKNFQRKELVEVLLETLAQVNPDNKGTIKEIDYALSVLMKSDFHEAAIGYVTVLLSNPSVNLHLDEFDSFTHALVSDPAEHLGDVVVRWLLLGESSLCRGLSDALHGDGIDGPPLDIKEKYLQIEDVQKLFICRKAIGWFFLKPTTAASILVSVLKVSDGEVASEIQRYLFDPLLVSYNSVRDYLVGLTIDGTVKECVDKALKQYEEYLDKIRSVPYIKEFQPSERHEAIQRRNKFEEMRDVHKKAHSESVFLSLVRKSVVLYGSKSVTFVKGGDGELRSVETALQSIGLSYEIPRMQISDPVGMSYMLRVFRNERLINK